MANLVEDYNNEQFQEMITDLTSATNELYHNSIHGFEDTDLQCVEDMLYDVEQNIDTLNNIVNQLKRRIMFNEMDKNNKKFQAFVEEELKNN